MSDPDIVEGPEFRWFAWHPVVTVDRGRRWLRFVWRRRYLTDRGAFFVNRVQR